MDKDLAEVPDAALAQSQEEQLTVNTASVVGKIRDLDRPGLTFAQGLIFS